MSADDLVRMINQIAQFFAPYPEADAVEGVRDHVAKFWDPTMRRELLAFDADARARLHPLALKAVAQLSVGTSK